LYSFSSKTSIFTLISDATKGYTIGKYLWFVALSLSAFVHSIHCRPFAFTSQLLNSFVLVICPLSIDRLGTLLFIIMSIPVIGIFRPTRPKYLLVLASYVYLHTCLFKFHEGTLAVPAKTVWILQKKIGWYRAVAMSLVSLVPGCNVYCAMLLEGYLGVMLIARELASPILLRIGLEYRDERKLVNILEPIFVGFALPVVAIMFSVPIFGPMVRHHFCIMNF
jgi:hypothetical protein